MIAAGVPERATGGPRALGWTAVCTVDRLVPDRGVAALVEGRAVAVFLLASGDVHAIDNLDPCSGASVLSRGIVGDVDDTPTVASPMFKQRFDLRTGSCRDGPERLDVHRVRIRDGVVEVQVTPEDD